MAKTKDGETVLQPTPTIPEIQKALEGNNEHMHEHDGSDIQEIHPPPPDADAASKKKAAEKAPEKAPEKGPSHGGRA